jgi:hypothetical protein
MQNTDEQHGWRYAQACVAVGCTITGLVYITVQDDPLFRGLIPQPCRGGPAKDTSPKARKSQDVVAGFVPTTVNLPALAAATPVRSSSWQPHARHPAACAGWAKRPPLARQRAGGAPPVAWGDKGVYNAYPLRHGSKLVRLHRDGVARCPSLQCSAGERQADTCRRDTTTATRREG